jgi:hypothetical protein
MKKIKVNTEVIKKLKPCTDRFENWLEHYEKFDGNITEFLSLDQIGCNDKIWVTMRLVPKDLAVTFSIDCVFAAYAYYTNASAAFADAAAAAAYAAHATYDYAAEYTAAASYAASYTASYAASYTATYAVGADAADTEKERQIDALIYLIETWEDV